MDQNSEWNDIHPVNKNDLGYRLVLAAQKVAYGEQQIVCSGPWNRLNHMICARL